MTIDIVKLQADVKAAKSDGEAAVVIVQAVKVEAQSLRMSGGGAAQPVIDELIRSLDAAIAALTPPPPAA